MNIKEFLYEKGLSSELDDADFEYIALCEKDYAGEAVALVKTEKELMACIERLKEKFLCATEKYRENTELILSAVKSYNDSRPGNGIWRTVAEEAERKDHLRLFYGFVKELDELSGRIAAIDFCLKDIPELRWRLSELEKRFLLYTLAGEHMGKNDKTQSKTERMSVKLDEIAVSAEKAELRALNGTSLISGYVSALALALDSSNKGERMDTGAARSCTLSFIASFDALM